MADKLWTDYGSQTLPAGADTGLFFDASETIVGQKMKETLMGNVYNALVAVPGGRLTLTSGLPVTTADVTAAQNIYYTPYVNNVLTLWDGNYWIPTVFTEITIPVGTITSGRPYDLFGYINAGAAAIEMLSWASTSARTTAISLQDGRYCKTGDKTRLYLGSFMTTATTTTEDSLVKRYLFNMYNRCARPLFRYNGTSHNYNATTVQPFNNDSANSSVEWLTGLGENSVSLAVSGQITRAATDGHPRIGVSLNTSAPPVELTGIAGMAFTGLVGRMRGGGSTVQYPAVGYNFATICEASSAGTAPGATFEGGQISTVVMA
jgi:hypothetical protein